MVKNEMTEVKADVEVGAKVNAETRPKLKPKIKTQVFNAVVDVETLKVDTIYDVVSNSIHIKADPLYNVVLSRLPNSNELLTIIDPYERMTSGRDTVSLKPMTFKQVNELKNRDKVTPHDTKEQPQVYMLDFIVSDFDKFFKDMDDDDWANRLDGLFLQGLDKDERLVKVAMSHMLPIPQMFQKYNNHTLMFTNSKTGKSEFSRIMGKEPQESPTVPGLVGGGPVNARATGLLQGSGFIYIDEINTYDTEIVTKLLNYLENGTAARAIHGAIMCTGSKTVVFCGNPRYPSPLMLAMSFAAILRSIAGSDALERLGNRIGLFVYGNDYTMITRKKVNTVAETERNSKTRVIIQDAFTRFKPKWYKLLEIAQVWLNKDDIKYKDDMQEMGKESHSIEIYAFLRGLACSSAKLRMSALKYVILVHLPQFVLDETDRFFEDNLEELEQAYLMYKNINLDSASKLQTAEHVVNYDTFAGIIRTYPDIIEMDQRRLGLLFGVSKMTVNRWLYKYNSEEEKDDD